jgi:hypothetical protein
VKDNLTDRSCFSSIKNLSIRGDSYRIPNKNVIFAITVYISRITKTLDSKVYWVEDQSKKPYLRGRV